MSEMISEPKLETIASETAGSGKLVKGYKVFKPDWTCRDKQYTCPGKFEEDEEIQPCESGMHFCKKLLDCFSYYPFNSDNKVAEVIAYGDVLYTEDKACTNKLEIVRELSWEEVLELVNMGGRCAGYANTGYYNSGNYNTGHNNSGDYNTGNANIGSRNTGCYNFSTGNSGNHNKGTWNSGDGNIGDGNSGHFNTGNDNAGNYNAGDGNSGDWNTCSYSNGCFNTLGQKMYMFNQPSDWTYEDWLGSEARRVLERMPKGTEIELIVYDKMTDKEKALNPLAKITGVFQREVPNYVDPNEWWDSLDTYKKEAVLNLPNFNSKIFKEITGIDVERDMI